MNDKEIMENILLNLKGECDLLMHGAVESSTADVHSAFTQCFNDTLAMQNEVYSKMAQKGWYPAQNADAQQISAVKQKYSAQR
jgi:spore coat protein CotF